jgi:hypothetical protein
MAKLLYPASQNFVQKALGAELLSGVTASATLNNLTGVQNKPGVMIIDRIDTNNVETPSKREVVIFDSTSGSTVVTLTRNADGSGTDQDHSVGAIVEFGPDILWAQRLIDGLVAVVDPSTGALDTTKVVAQGGTGASLTLVSPNFGTLSSLPLVNPVVNGGVLTNPYVVNGTFASLPLFTGQVRQMQGALTPFVTISDAEIMYLDFSTANKWLATIVPSGSRTFLATNATLGNVGLLRVTYASTASLALGLLNSAASTSLVNWPSGTRPTPTATQGKGDMFGFVCVSTTPGFDAITVGQNL